MRLAGADGVAIGKASVPPAPPAVNSGVTPGRDGTVSRAVYPVHAVGGRARLQDTGVSWRFRKIAFPQGRLRVDSG